MISISSLTLGRHGTRPEGLRDLLKGHIYVVRIRIQELHGKRAGQVYLRMVVTVLHVPVMTLTTRYFWGPRRSEEDRSSSRATIHEAHASTRRAPPCFSILNLQAPSVPRNNVNDMQRKNLEHVPYVRVIAVKFGSATYP